MNSDKNITEDELHRLLTEKYGCTKDGTGKSIPAPYCSEDDMPTYYKTPSGLFFDVPPPPNGATYSIYDVRDIIEVARLEVVTSFEEAKEKSAIKSPSSV